MVADGAARLDEADEEEVRRRGDAERLRRAVSGGEVEAVASI